MEKMEIAVIGGGAAGLFFVNALHTTKEVLLVERGERLGRKLSATGNGQGNVTNLRACGAEYFSVSKGEETQKRVGEILSAFDNTRLTAFFEGLGVPCSADERGRVYPAGKQASALTDALRFSLRKKGVKTLLNSEVTALTKQEGGFVLTLQSEEGEKRYFARKVVLCAGGKAAKNFGTDGSAYALAKGLGHTVTPLYPSLVQLKTETAAIKSLKGIRVGGVALTAVTPTRTVTVQGDIIFTDYGLSGDAVFRLTAFIAGEIPAGGCAVYLDFLPDYTEAQIYALLQAKGEAYPDLAVNELLFGVVNNQLGRAIFRRAENQLLAAAKLVKKFPLSVTGSLGFDYAQVTKGGIPLCEVTDRLESRFAEGLYFAGEILDVDGQCGGFNLQWAYSSANVVAKAIEGGRYAFNHD